MLSVVEGTRLRRNMAVAIDDATEVHQQLFGANKAPDGSERINTLSQQLALQDAVVVTSMQAARARRPLPTLGAALDHTDHVLERALAEIEAQRRVAATLERLGRVGQEITANLDTGAILRILKCHAETLLDVSALGVWLLDYEHHVLMPVKIAGDDARADEAQIELDDALACAAQCYRERTEIVTTHAERVFQLCSVRSTMLAPFRLGERVLGVLAIGSERSGAYGEHERSIVRSLCAYAAIALDNAAAYREVRRTVIKLQAAQRDLAQRTAEYERLAMTDALTALPNRRYFISRAAVEIGEARRTGGAVAVAIFDIDHFKRVNDSCGHFAGDRVLKMIATTAREALRPTDFIARIGGEEFALLLPGMGLSEAANIAERIRASFERTTPNEIATPVTASFGVAVFEGGVDTVDEVLVRADRALYCAKAAGRNRVCCDPSWQAGLATFEN